MKNFTKLEVGSWYRAANDSLIQVTGTHTTKVGDEVRFTDGNNTVYEADGTFLFESLRGNNSSLMEKVILEIKAVPKKAKKLVSLSFVMNPYALKALAEGTFTGTKNYMKFVPPNYVEDGLTTVTLQGEVEVDLPPEVEPSDIPF